MSVIEHTLNILIFPGLHSDSRGTENLYADLVDSTSSTSIGVNAHMPRPCLNVPGLKRLCLPSPLHLKLHVLTRLSFNEQGRITRHRDFWDVRDVIGLVPGMTVAQWIATRVAAQGLSYATRIASWMFGRKRASSTNGDCEGGPSADGASNVPCHGGDEHTPPSATPNALGLQLNESERRAWSLVQCPGDETSQAPDVDRDPGS